MGPVGVMADRYRPAECAYASWPPVCDADDLVATMPWAVITGPASHARIQVRAATEVDALAFAEAWAGGRVAWLPDLPGAYVDVAAAASSPKVRAALEREDQAAERKRHRKRRRLASMPAGGVAGG
jgi:hypothetical protein